MDTIYNLKDLVVPVIGCYKGQPGKVVGIRTRDLDDLQVITVRFPGVYRPVEYLPSDVRPLFEERRAARLERVRETNALLLGESPLLAITDVGGYDWEPLNWNRYGRVEHPWADDPYDEQDGLVGEFFDDLGLSDEEDDGCQGHPAGPFDPMGETVYCDGSCRG